MNKAVCLALYLPRIAQYASICAYAIDFSGHYLYNITCLLHELTELRSRPGRTTDKFQVTLSFDDVTARSEAHSFGQTWQASTIIDDKSGDPPIGLSRRTIENE